MLTWRITCRRFRAQCPNSGGSQAKQNAFFGIGRLRGTFLGGGGHCRGPASSSGGAVTLGHLGRDVNHILWCASGVVPEPLQGPTLNTAGTRPARRGSGMG